MNGRPWSEEQLAILRRLYPTQSTKKLAKRLRRSESSVCRAAYKLGIHKTEEYLQSPDACRLRRGDGVGVAFQFPQGHVPANKGLRRPGYSPGRMKETQFRKGERPQNRMPIGTVLTDSDGYRRIKVRDSLPGEPTGTGNRFAWPFLQRHVWEQNQGPIPAGHVVAFIDKNRQNCAIENLECISRGDLANRNKMWGRYPRELAEAIQLNGQLKRKLRSLHA